MFKIQLTSINNYFVLFSPYLIGLILGIQNNSHSLFFDFLKISILVVILLFAFPHLAKSFTLLANSFKQGARFKKYFPVLVYFLLMASLSIVCIGTLRLYLETLSFIIATAWFLTSITSHMKLSNWWLELLVLVIKSLSLGLLGFSAIKIEYSLPVLLICLAASFMTTGYEIVSRHLNDRPTNLFRRTCCILLTLGPATIMIMSSYNFLESSYSAIIFILILAMPFFEQLLKKDSIIDLNLVDSLRIYSALFILAIYLIEALNRLDSLMKYIEVK